MVMDISRSCFRQALRFVRNDLGEQVYGTWYRAAPTALPFPIPHRFGSPVWDNERGEFSDLGFNAQTPAAWVDGRRLNSSDGTKFAGPLEYFVEGCPAPAQLPRGTNGTPVECLRPPFGLMTGGTATQITPAAGGLRTGGSTTPSYTPGANCANCPGDAPLTITVTSSGFTGAYVDYNGSFQLVQTASPCVWFLALAGTHALTLTRLPGNIWRLEFAGSITITQYSATVPNCLTAAVLYRDFTGTPCDTTVTISIP